MNYSLQQIQEALPAILKDINLQLGLPTNSNLLNLTINDASGDWLPIEGASKYEQHAETRAVRNAKTYRILATTKSGYVNIVTDQGERVMYRAKP
ncbi:hypothetical protein G3R49_19370 [Shewanella sp. WXL01]|uniref:hypothetical protein n=1 Tax=Shewanella sp. WXL01 TaxID=2709721 RepID=UPI00143837AE|nr:hypothetical protein [Shewanella sp. WXL01]NKF52720.1 hypothetical protein [Shewanella sp. WXL01]